MGNQTSRSGYIFVTRTRLDTGSPVVYDVFPAAWRLAIQARTKLANNPPLKDKRVVLLLIRLDGTHD